MNKKIYKKSSILKAKILSYGFRISPEVQDSIGKEVKEEHRGYGDSNWGEENTYKIPAEIMLPGEIVVATHIRPDSPLCLKKIDKGIVITENEKVISEINLLKRPNIWSEKTKEGISMKKIVNFYGRDG